MNMHLEFPRSVAGLQMVECGFIFALFQLGPNVTIGKNVCVGAGVRVRESIILEGAVLKDHCCILHSIVGWHSSVGEWSRVEGTPNDPNPNKPFAKLEIKEVFNSDGRLNPSITVIGECGMGVL